MQTTVTQAGLSEVVSLRALPCSCSVCPAVPPATPLFASVVNHLPARSPNPAGRRSGAVAEWSCKTRASGGR